MCWQGTSCLIFVYLFIIAGMVSSQTDQKIADYIDKLEAKDIQMVVICQDEYVEKDLFGDFEHKVSAQENDDQLVPLFGDFKYKGSARKNDVQLFPIVAVTNRVVIDPLADALKSGLSERVSLEDLPFSGILSYQVFVTRQKYLLITHVIRGEDGIVAASIGKRHKKGYRLVGEDMILITSQSFSKKIQQLMSDNEESEAQEKDRTEKKGVRPIK